MAMQLAAAVVARQPAGDKCGTGIGLAGLEIAMRTSVRGKSVVGVERQRPLDFARPDSDGAGFDARPAEIGQKPSILAPVRREPFQQRQLRLVMVEPAAEPQQPEHPERQ
jgi:hypothetical protein